MKIYKIEKKTLLLLDRNLWKVLIHRDSKDEGMEFQSDQGVRSKELTVFKEHIIMYCAVTQRILLCTKC